MERVVYIRYTGGPLVGSQIAAVMAAIRDFSGHRIVLQVTSELNLKICYVLGVDKLAHIVLGDSLEGEAEGLVLELSA